MPAPTPEVFATDVDAGGTDLRWYPYIPAAGGPTFPTVVLFHGGQFKQQTPGPGNVAQDLANAGFLTFAAEFRLAPPHTEMTNSGPPGDGQQDPPSDGRPPQQTLDVRSALRAARVDPRSTGWVAAAGGSSGATIAAWAVIKGTDNDDRPNAFVGCSGLYDLDDANLLSSSYKGTVENYINHLISEGAAFHTAAQAASPYWQTVNGTPCPSILFNGSTEVIPQTTFNGMITKLGDAGGTVESHLVTGSVHAFSYWNMGYGGSFSTVKDCSIDFLYRMLAQTPPPVIGPASIVVKKR